MCDLNVPLSINLQSVFLQLVNTAVLQWSETVVAFIL